MIQARACGHARCGPRRVLGLLIIGGVGSLGSLLLLDAVVPDGLPSWFGYLVAGVCIAFVYTQIIRAYIAKRARRRAGADESTGGEG